MKKLRGLGRLGASTSEIWMSGHSLPSWRMRMEAMVERRLKRARGWIWDARWGREGRFLGPRVGGGSSLFRGHNYARWTALAGGF